MADTRPKFLDNLPQKREAVQRADEHPMVLRRYNTKLEGWMIPVAVRAVGEGLPLARVAGLLGVTPRTLEKWRSDGENPACKDPLKVELSVEIEKARSEAAQAGVQIMKLHGLKDWRAQLELLRAQDPDTWSPQTRSKVEVTVKGPERDLSKLTDEELAQLEALESKTLGAG